MHIKCQHIIVISSRCVRAWVCAYKYWSPWDRVFIVLIFGFLVRTRAQKAWKFNWNRQTSAFFLQMEINVSTSRRDVFSDIVLKKKKNRKKKEYDRKNSNVPHPLESFKLSEMLMLNDVREFFHFMHSSLVNYHLFGWHTAICRQLWSTCLTKYLVKRKTTHFWASNTDCASSFSPISFFPFFVVFSQICTQFRYQLVGRNIACLFTLWNQYLFIYWKWAIRIAEENTQIKCRRIWMWSKR